MFCCVLFIFRAAKKIYQYTVMIYILLPESSSIIFDFDGASRRVAVSYTHLTLPTIHSV